MNNTLVDPETSGETSVWEDFVDIYFSPSSVFERRRDGRLWPALVLLTIVLTALTFAFMSALSAAYDADMARALARSGEDIQIPAAAMAMGRALASFGSIVMVPLGVAIGGLLLWLVGKLFGAELTFTLGATIATYAAFPRVLQTLVGTLQGILMNPDSMSRVSTGPARFLDPATTHETVMALLGRFDLFVIWSVILTAIGVRIIGRTEASGAWATALILWLLVTIPTAISVAIAS